MRMLRSDLPLAGDASGRFLPWIIGCMVYLATLALAAAIIADSLADRWQSDLAGTYTIQIPPRSDITSDAREAMVGSVVELAAGAAGVARVNVVNEAEKARLLEPWFGAAGLPDTIRLPDLVVIEMSEGETLDVPAIGGKLREFAPGATIEDHQRWQGDLATFTRSVKTLAAMAIAFIIVAAIATIVFVTKTGLEIHRRVIEIVHLVGAQDSYIARQFLIHALRQGLVGGIAGVALAILTLVLIERMIAHGATAVLPELSLHAGQWLLLALAPLAVGTVSMITAHLTVLRALGRGI
ncbi:MAG: cell division protein FtsX [Dongiaceae bacterium]